LGAALTSLAPLNAFNQTFTANAFNQRFVGQMSQRSLALRGGSRSQSAFSIAGPAGQGQTDNATRASSPLAFFGSASGAFLASNNQANLVGSQAGPFAHFAQLGAGQGHLATNRANEAQPFSLAQAGELTVGADVSAAEGLHIGFAISSVHNSQPTNGSLQAQQNQSTSLGIYGSYSADRFFADAYAGTAWQEFGVSRDAQGGFEALFDNAVSNSAGRQSFGGLRVGYDLTHSPGFEIGPMASLDYARSDIAGYEELGASALGLRIEDRSFTSLSAKAGAIASADFAVSRSSRARAFGAVALARELADTADVVTASFAGARDLPFTIENAIDPSWIALNAGLEFSMGGGFQTSLSFSSDMGRGILSDRQGRIAIGWRF
jgi:uncharacterized protein YhjY with autotransporter beta-barrel domain